MAALRVSFALCRAGAQPPKAMTDGAAGLDLAACLAPGPSLVLEPGARTLVPTGLVLQIPSGYEGQVRPRSGLALRAGITVLNAPGTIDADYRGELRVLLVHLGQEPHEIRHGDRIAQLIIAPVVRAQLVQVDALANDGGRSSAGFGSTGA